jgi:SAM-dependent methyltransferase
VDEALYTSGRYMEMNPGWHVEESPWKAQQILRMLSRHGLAPRNIAEVGCGAGEVLRQLQLAMSPECHFTGYDISPHAIEMSRSRANDRLQFYQVDLAKEPIGNPPQEPFDLLLILDVVEHVEDYYSFLRSLRPWSRHAIFHVPLELSVQTILRTDGLLGTQVAYGHLHYFTAELAQQALRNSGYVVRDYFYTARALEIPTQQLRRRLVNLPRKVLFTLNQTLASRTLGGFSLLVLTENVMESTRAGEADLLSGAS